MLTKPRNQTRSTASLPSGGNTSCQGRTIWTPPLQSTLLLFPERVCIRVLTRACTRYAVCSTLYLRVGSEFACQVTVYEVPPPETGGEPETNPAFTAPAVMET